MRPAESNRRCFAISDSAGPGSFPHPARHKNERRPSKNRERMSNKCIRLREFPRAVFPSGASLVPPLLLPLRPAFARTRRPRGQ